MAVNSAPSTSCSFLDQIYFNMLFNALGCSFYGVVCAVALGASVLATVMSGIEAITACVLDCGSVSASYFVVQQTKLFTMFVHFSFIISFLSKFYNRQIGSRCHWNRIGSKCTVIHLSHQSTTLNAEDICS